ncbi:PREDICTED: transmembrane protein 207 isoform X2 [Ficedula albicollis]|uniref:transmembrane protein 207 isoform X2 n=1 Tax=Ficedula albicollis TaxID=59894 RepID=UPI000359C6E0|nr:PREDICTED: transmembrane protein 207 isoform X2 [Ficedula albicollis]
MFLTLIMRRPGALCFTSWITAGAGVLCLTFFQSADSGSDCELGKRCVGQSDENLSSWFLVLFSLAVLLSCGMCCCLQCWLKRRSCLPRSTVAVFALSSSDAFGATEAPPCPFSGSLSPCRTAEISSSPAPCFSLGGTELPPSYEDVMKENKL